MTFYDIVQVDKHVKLCYNCRPVLASKVYFICLIAIIGLIYYVCIRLLKISLGNLGSLLISSYIDIFVFIVVSYIFNYKKLAIMFLVLYSVTLLFGLFLVVDYLNIYKDVERLVFYLYCSAKAIFFFYLFVTWQGLLVLRELYIIVNRLERYAKSLREAYMYKNADFIESLSCDIIDAVLFEQIYISLATTSAIIIVGIIACKLFFRRR